MFIVCLHRKHLRLFSSWSQLRPHLLYETIFWSKTKYEIPWKAGGGLGCPVRIPFGILESPMTGSNLIYR